MASILSAPISSKYFNLENSATKMKKNPGPLPKNFFKEFTSVGLPSMPYIVRQNTHDMNMIQKIINIRKLFEFQNFEENWDEDGAKAIPKNVLKNVFYLIFNLPNGLQPRVSALYDGGLALSFNSKYGHNLAFEFYGDKVLYAIGVRNEAVVIYYTGYVGGPEDFFNIIFSFYGEKLPDGTTFKRFVESSIRQD